MNLQAYSKAFVPVIVMGALAVLGLLGVTAQMSVEEAITLLVTAAGVYFVRNRTA